MKAPRVLEITAAAICVVPWAAIAIGGPDLRAGDDAWILSLWIGGGLVAGFCSRSWRLAGLLALIVAGCLLLARALHPCAAGPGAECEVNSPALALFYFLPATVVIVGVGVLIRCALELTVERLRSRTAR